MGQTVVTVEVVVYMVVYVLELTVVTVVTGQIVV